MTKVTPNQLSRVPSRALCLPRRNQPLALSLCIAALACGGSTQTAGSTGGSTQSTIGGSASGGTGHPTTGGSANGGASPPATGGADNGGSSSNSGASNCLEGDEGCSCFRNETCMSGLTCASHLCVRLGTGGASSFGGAPPLGGSNMLGSTSSAAATGGAALGGAAASGGFAATGGATTTGFGGMAGHSTAAVTTGGSASLHPLCDSADAGARYTDAGLERVGGTDPSGSVNLETEGFYRSGSYHGYCFTFYDSASTIFPRCGGTEDCFTEQSGLCVRASLPAATASNWGIGLGCALNEDLETGEAGAPVSIADKHSMSFGIYGCNTPSRVRLQLTVDPPIYDAAQELLHSGYYCVDVELPEPDANGVRSVGVDLTKFMEDCWTGPGLPLDRTSQTVKSIQLQVNTSPSQKTELDFCVSSFELQ